MKIIYAGTPEFALPALQALIDSAHEIVAVYTQPDRPAGRGRKLQMSPVKARALEHGLTVCQPVNFKDDVDVQAMRKLGADLMVVAAYGLLLPPAVLNAPRLGCVNIHASLLPRWRGAAPIQRAILAGDLETGITLMQMDEGLDTGNMLAKSRIPIEQDMTAQQLHDRLMVMGGDLLMQNLAGIEAAQVSAEVQDAGLATYAAKLNRDEARIDWTKSAERLLREIRAYNPWPVSHTTVHGQNLKIWAAGASSESASGEPGRVLAHDRQGVRVACGNGTLNVTHLQLAGRKRQAASDLLNSINLNAERLGA
jgi:methionyl-tRNA formyltransferase